MTDSPTPTDTGKKLTKAQKRVLAKFGTAFALSYGHEYAPPKHLEAAGLIARYGTLDRRPAWRITEAGRQALAALPKDNHHD